MSDDSKVYAYGRAVVEGARAARATRAHVIADARVERRRGRELRDESVALRERNLELCWRLWSLRALPEPPSVIPTSWTPPLEGGSRMDDAITAAEECADACISAIRAGGRRERDVFAAIAGACSLGAKYGREAHRDSAAALGLCVRVIESKAEDLDSVADTPSGLLAVTAARRCVQCCKRALIALFPTDGD